MNFTWDILIWAVYSIFPIALGHLLWKRRDIPYPRIFWLFSALIFACGTIHLVGSRSVTWPFHSVSDVLEVTTAVASWAAIVALIPLAPKALQYSGMARFNEQLQKEIEQRKAAEEQLKILNQGLEQAVATKIADLRRSEQHLHLAQKAALVGAWEFDPAAARFTFSHEMMALYGFTDARSRLDVDEWLELVHPDDRIRAARDLERAVSGRGAYESEFRILRPDDSVRYLLGQGKLLTFSQDAGTRVSLAGVHVDITHRKEMDEAIATQVDDEKQRISEELHDGLGQQLTGLGFLAKSLQRSLEQDGLPHAVQAGELSQAIPGIVKDLRAVIRGLMPVEIDAIGLMSALEQLANATASRSSTNCRLECVTEVEIQDEETSLQLYRIAQEAVNNAVKHAQASLISIRLHADDDTVRLEVMDDGQGLPDNLEQAEGMGMRILRHRAAKLGASLTIQSKPGKGTHVCCVWPRNVSDGRSTWEAMENLNRG